MNMTLSQQLVRIGHISDENTAASVHLLFEHEHESSRGGVAERYQ